jgi:hypothetical protein
MVPRPPRADQPYGVAAPSEDDRDETITHQAVDNVARLAVVILGRSDLEHVAEPDLLRVDEVDAMLGHIGPALNLVPLELHAGQ